MSRTTTREVRVAPNIWKSVDEDGLHVGWRVYLRQRDPRTGRSVKKPKRFPSETTIEELEYLRNAHKLETKRLRRERRTQAAAAATPGLFSEDAKTYLALKTVKAMPSYKDRDRHITWWSKAFASRKRSSLTTRDIDEQLQQLRNDGKAASTVNGFRTALMAMFSTLDGRGAANPVREAMVFEEPELEPRGIPFALVLTILDAIPDGRSHSHLRPSTVHPLKTKPRLMLEALTGMRPSQVGRLARGKHFSIDERWYVIPRSQKGAQRRRPRNPRPSTRKHMTERQAEAFQRFHDLDCYGAYSASSRRRIFNAAVKEAEQVIKKQLRDPSFRFPADLRPQDLRHSFGSEMLRRTGNLETTAEMLDQSTTRMTRRYALGAIPEVLKKAALAFEDGLPASSRAASTIKPPRAPRRRGGPKQRGPGSL